MHFVRNYFQDLIWKEWRQNASTKYQWCFLQLEIFWTQAQQPDFGAACSPPASCWLILIVAGCKEYIMRHSTLESYYHTKLGSKDSRRGNSNTSVLESVSASLCFMSFAIEKKTSSTFRFVFALCNRKMFQCMITKKVHEDSSFAIMQHLQSQRT